MHRSNGKLPEQFAADLATLSRTEVTLQNPVEAGFRSAMRRLASSVAVITSFHDGIRYAMAATSVQSLSMDPPSLVACVKEGASLHFPLFSRAPFCVNILSASQISIAEACGGKAPLSRRFDIGEWRETENGVPYLLGAQANIKCDTAAHVPWSTHGIFIGHVTEVQTTTDIEPLVYVDGRYIGLNL
ncbi:MULTISPECIES: flavin reductase family protein [Paraburkholderia]|uniref:Flavin reductase family protein n=1 Tax=Paraburkholderia metrosideri TaxID=580937 RepID=A0ABW9E334_9BURK